MGGITPLAGLVAEQPGLGDVLRDRGYDARAVLDLIAAGRGCRAGARAGGDIPTQRDRKLQRSVDPEIYPMRKIVERFSSKLKRSRKVATRYEKSVRNYLRSMLMACSRLWAKDYGCASWVVLALSRSGRLKVCRIVAATTVCWPRWMRATEFLIQDTWHHCQAEPVLGRWRSSGTLERR